MYAIQLKGGFKHLLITEAYIYHPRTITAVKTSQLFPGEGISQC